MALLRKILDRLKLTDILICWILFIVVAFLSGSYAVFFAVTFLLAAMIFSLAVYHHKMNKLDKKAFNYSVVFFSFIAFCTIAVVARNLKNINASIGIFLILLNIALLSAGIVLAVLLKTINIKLSKEFLLKCLPLAAVALLVFLLSLPLFKTVPIFDEWFYYDHMSATIDVSTLNDLNALKICRHMTHFWTITTYVISCITGNLYSAIILFNILLLMLSIPVVYKTIRLACPGCDYWFAYLCAVMFAVSPFTFGFTGYSSPQSILGLMILFFLYAFVVKNKVLIFVTATMMIFTFEIGVFLTAILVFLTLLFSLLRAIALKNFAAELKKQGLNVLNICLVLIHFVWLAIFLQANWGGIGTDEIAGGGISYGFNDAMYENLTLFSNFNWIIYAGILAALIKLSVQLVIRKIPLKSVIGNKPVIMFIGAFLIFFVSFTIINTLNYVRYYLPIYLCSYLLFFACIHYLFRDIKIKKLSKAFSCGSLVVLSIFLIIQSYITIDPVMLSILEKTYMGSGKNYVVNAAYNDRTNQPFGDFIWDFFDAYVYNRQSSDFSIAFNKALSSMDYNTEKCIIVSFDISKQYILENKYYGMGYRHVESRGFHGWDNTKKQQYIVYDKNEAIRYTIRQDAESIQELLQENEYKEYWFLDYNSGIAASIQSLTQENNSIKIENSHDVTYMGWGFTLSKVYLNN